MAISFEIATFLLRRNLGRRRFVESLAMTDRFPQRNGLPHDTPSWGREEAVFSITINTRQRGLNQLARNEAASLIRASMEFNMSRHHCWAFLLLLMPDHLHGLFSFADDPGMKKTLTDWKHYVARESALEWQRDFFDHRLRADESFEGKAEYIRMNPVRAGLVRSPEDWPHVWGWGAP